MGGHKMVDQEKVRVGQKIVRVVAAVHIVMSFVHFFVNLYTYHFFSIAFVILVCHIGLAVALIRGFMLVRYLMAANAAFVAWGAADVLLSENLSLWVVLFHLLIFVVAVWASYLLFFNKSVTAYMLERNDGG